MHIMPTRTMIRLVAAAIVMAGCGGSGESDSSTSDSASAAGTAAPTTTAAPSTSNTGPASITAEDIDRWQKGMEAELETVKKAGADLKAAKTVNDTATAMAAANDMSTQGAGANAAGVDNERYQLIRTTLSSVVGQMAPIEQEMDVSKLPATAVAELKKGRDESLARETAELSPQLVEALKPRAAALRKQDLTLTAERLKASGMGR